MDGCRREGERDRLFLKANGKSFLQRVMKMVQLGLKHMENEDEY